MDIIGASFYDSHVAWWENVDGSGTNWVQAYRWQNRRPLLHIYGRCEW